MGRLIEFIFQKVYLALLASGIFFLLSFCGGIVFGVAPAGATVMSLFAEHGYDYQGYSWSEAWDLFKRNSIRSNLIYYTFFAVGAGLVYSLYLLVQLPPTLVTILLTFFQALLVLFICFAYSIYLKLQVYFEMSYLDSLKLSFIGLFVNAVALIKLMIGTVLLVFLGLRFPAVGFFLLVGAWHFYVSDVLEPVYRGIEEKMG